VKTETQPRLRFPEFQNAGEWEVKAIGDVFSVTRGEVLSMTLVKEEASEEAPFPVYSSQTKNKGVAGYYSEHLYEDAITWTTDGANAGDVNFRPGKFYCTNVCGVLINTNGCANACIAALLNSVTRSHVSYVGNPKLMNGMMAKIEIPFPPLPEQQKIAECLSSVDELMAAQARKVDALKTHKKGLMQQLFPREGETQPRLRFPEFQNAGAWEDDKLGSVCELYQPVTLTASDLTMTGEYLVYGANGIIGSHDVYNHEESEIAVTCRGATCGEVTVTKPKSWITGNAMIVKPRTRKLRKDFIFHYFKNHGLKAIISGSAQPQITRTGFAPLVVFFPKPAEQQRIATCLSSLDALITAETQKHEALKTHKKGLMQQLFPSPEEVVA
jgi:type I restriction enzyme S subunit